MVPRLNAQTSRHGAMVTVDDYTAAARAAMNRVNAILAIALVLVIAMGHLLPQTLR